MVAIMARPRKFDEAEVVAAARDEFWSRGYAATSVEDLTAATGLGKGSLYGAFGDKHALFLRALDDYVATGLGTVRSQLRASKGTPLQRLANHIRAQANTIAADTARRGCLAAKSAAELNPGDTAVAAATEKMMSAWRAELADTIRAAQRDGEIDPGQDPQALATTVLAFIRGMEALRKAGVKPAPLKAAAGRFTALLGE
jgi:TetR/AcrR family transcriptional regulator, transcriptional repressor for nem operon